MYAQVLVYGMMSGQPASVPIVPMLNNVSVHGFWLTNYIKPMSPQQKQDTVNTVMDLIERRD